MPCDSVITSSIVWGKDTDPAILKAALEAEGCRCNLTETSLGFAGADVWGEYNLKTHKMTIRNADAGQESRFKQRYSMEIVNSQAKRFGWKVSWGTSPQGNPLAKVEKRRL